MTGFSFLGDLSIVSAIVNRFDFKEPLRWMYLYVCDSPPAEDQHLCFFLQSEDAWQRNCLELAWASQNVGSSDVCSWHPPLREYSTIRPLWPQPASSETERKHYSTVPDVSLNVYDHFKELSLRCMFTFLFDFSFRLWKHLNITSYLTVLAGLNKCSNEPTLRSENCCWILGRSIRYFSISSFSSSSLLKHE